MGDTKATGLAALEERLQELRDNDEDLNSNLVDGEDISAEESNEVVKESSKENEENAEAKGETEASTEKDESEEIPSEENKTSETEGDTKEIEENRYSPNYQYKFQDEMFEFDDRVKSAIKSEEDEEYFRDLYTKSRAMELMKERSETTIKDLDDIKGKYSSLENEASQKENMINYFTSIMDGVNRGDAQAFNQFLNLCNTDQQALKSLALVMAEHLENPTGYDQSRQQYQAQYQQQQNVKQQEDYERRQAEINREHTGLEIKKALQNPEISEIVEYVDNTWGAGTFENRVWAEGQALEAKQDSVSLDVIPNLVKDVADWFSKAKQPAPSSKAEQKEQLKVKQQVVDNPTESLPQVKGDRGVPQKPVYTEGSGIEGLQKRYKDITGSEW